MDQIKHTLLLNADYQPMCFYPLSTVHWKRAVTALYLEKIKEPLAWHDHWVVRSPSFETRVPSIIVTKEHHKRNEKVKFCKRNVFLRDIFKCQYCGETFIDGYKHLLTWDHVTPKAKGGRTEWTNLVTSCYDCNLKKGDKDPVGHWKPKNAPHEPVYFDLLAGFKKAFPLTIRDEAWLDYINWPNDNVKLVKPIGNVENRNKSKDNKWDRLIK